MWFKDKDLAAFWADPTAPTSRRLRPPMGKAVFRKLQMLDAACSVGDLRVPPGNRLEQLKGDRSGQWSIRVNDRWRICFEWTENGPKGVELCDYH